MACEARRRDCKVKIFKKQSLSRLRRQLPLHKGAFHKIHSASIPLLAFSHRLSATAPREHRRVGWRDLRLPSAHRQPREGIINIPPLCKNSKIADMDLYPYRLFYVNTTSVLSKCALAGEQKASLVQREVACEARRRDCKVKIFKKQSLSRLGRQLPLHKGAFGGNRLFSCYAI